MTNLQIKKLASIYADGETQELAFVVKHYLREFHPHLGRSVDDPYALSDGGPQASQKDQTASLPFDAPLAA